MLTLSMLIQTHLIAIALLTMTVLEQHPRLHHMEAAVQTQQEVR